MTPGDTIVVMTVAAIVTVTMTMTRTAILTNNDSGNNSDNDNSDTCLSSQMNISTPITNVSRYAVIVLLIAGKLVQGVKGYNLCTKIAPPRTEPDEIKIVSENYSDIYVSECGEK